MFTHASSILQKSIQMPFTSVGPKNREALQTKNRFYVQGEKVEEESHQPVRRGSTFIINLSMLAILSCFQRLQSWTGALHEEGNSASIKTPTRHCKEKSNNRAGR
jgi:hypothetical protein